VSAKKTRGPLAALWGEEKQMAVRLTVLAEAVGPGRQRARLMVLAAFHRAHASRLYARLAAMGRPLLPVPDEPQVPAGMEEELRSLLVAEGALAERFGHLAETCREGADLSSAWVCELNRTECLDAAGELRRMLEPQQRASA
jgi:hypothetical protein